eukprot:Em0004g70a
MQEMKDPTNRKISVYIDDASIGQPTVPETNVYAKTVALYPSECRQSATSYKAKLNVTVSWKIDGRPAGSISRCIGHVPIMVKSNRCRLAHLSPRELVLRHEEAEEMGGYFIINGKEKIVRMLIMPRRNYPIAITRSSWKSRGPAYTEYGISISCARKDQTFSGIILHYLTDGSCIVRFSKNKQLYYVPLVLILKSLVDTTDVHIFSEIMKGSEDDMFLKGCVSGMLYAALDEGVVSQATALKYIGERLRTKAELPDWLSDEDVARHLLKELVLVHLDNNIDKFNILICMARKLYAVVQGKCAVESADSPMNQEVLLGGQLFLMALKERLEGLLRVMKFELEKAAQKTSDKFEDSTINSVIGVAMKETDIGHQMEYLLATGNLRSRSGLGLQQMSGFTVVADKINFYRYLSHFRCVHRGSFFAQMRTTAVRKLLPEAWGFICPVHTPDGAPCGLLNHLAVSCRVTTSLLPTSQLPSLLASFGMHPVGTLVQLDHKSLVVVLLDGRLIGYVQATKAAALATKLRELKVLGKDNVPNLLEIGLIPLTKNGVYPGLYLFSTPGRMVRPVLNLSLNAKEWIGSFEQVYMDIAVIASEAHKGHTTHLELSEGAMLNEITCFIPYSDCNQSPRNMYQCQMGKQTMGMPVHSFPYRTDNKLYKLQTPQTPMVKPYLYDHFGIDEYPIGTNAIVAVISYTGYDMEDAMILNKASFERGFAHATVYKSELIDLATCGGGRDKNHLIFGCKALDKQTEGILDEDGLPQVGAKLKEGDPFYSYMDTESGKCTVVRYKSSEPACVDEVKLLGNENGDRVLQRVYIKLRINRNPVIGDKFASRHGQKGICSQKWPVENMPFTESGLVPDIIFNPHGYPSRMTIGMMIETMAGKSAALHGLCHDATPFTFSEEKPAYDFFGKMLLQAGYNYFGHERMYSGIDGREFEVDVFFGVVYYQRLRHMVSDKFQVRTTGPVDILTHQPVKGRKKSGGIRFGEMERDSLLAHGSSFLLQDRLLNCSDRSFAHVCKHCGSIISPVLQKALPSDSALSYIQPDWRCSMCENGGNVETVSVPYVFRYLTAELAAMNIRITLETH